MSSDTYQPIDYGEDVSPEELRAPQSSTGEAFRVALIRTSDRILFKRCRRQWGWRSHLKGNLGPKETQNPLWFGTGMHYALEDYHGYNKYGTPARAFDAFCQATYALREKVHLPAAFPELRTLGIGMMNYYSEQWLKDRDPLKTLWIQGVPQVEVRVLLEVPWNPKEYFPDSPFDKVVYSVTIDRVIEDENGLLWPIDYKSAKQMQVMHFATDPQVSAYYWVCSHLYPGRQIGGFIYQQHRKDIPQDPRVTAGGRLSTDKRQLVTHRSYRSVLVNIFGPDSQRWPRENLDFLNELAAVEEPDKDRFIRRDVINRNEFQFESEGTKILLELSDMLNPDLPLYPNPTRDCQYQCPMLHACISMDDGSDYAYELEMAHEQRPTEQDSWRNYLPNPEDIK